MGFQGLDLVYELQVELAWDRDFATGAREEYLRWLELRAKQSDFEVCKYPPSRVVAMVWNLHRQWTMDYEKVCNSLGGFIHHYPPSMRISLPREQAYAATYQLYKTQFDLDPPARYWGPPICQFKPSSAELGVEAEVGTSPSAAQLQTPQRKEPQSTESPRGSGSGRGRRKSASDPPPLTNMEFAQGVNALSDTQNKAIRSTVPAVNFDSKSGSSDPLHDLSGKVKKQKRPYRSTKIQQGYVLKPLAPGEKRRRGRPSLSEYIPVTEVTETQNVAQATSVAVAQASPFARRKNGTGKVPETNGMRTQRDSGEADTTDAAAAAASATHAARGGLASGQVLLKRPRGRPRKDGSWPIPRARAFAAPPNAQLPTSSLVSPEPAPVNSAEHGISPTPDRPPIQDNHDPEQTLDQELEAGLEASENAAREAVEAQEAVPDNGPHTMMEVEPQENGENLVPDVPDECEMQSNGS